MAQRNSSSSSGNNNDNDHHEFNEFTKAAFARLLQSFGENTADVVKVTKAFALAGRLHKGQQWNRSEPHVNHSLRVALILAEELQIRDADLVCAALLHDAAASQEQQGQRNAGVASTAGSAATAAAAAVQEYGERVQEIVAKTAAEPAAAKGEGRDKALEDYFARLAKAPKDVRYVKLAERIDSVRSMKNHASRERITRYKEETQKYVMPLAERTDDKLLLKLSVALYELK